jgi:arylsulfatase A-like enzyme
MDNGDSHPTAGRAGKSQSLLPPGSSEKMKNVILLHADQMRADGLGCMGNRFARTPRIDELAAGGTVYTRHVASNPICSPSRASLLTGLYPPGHGLWCNGVALNRRDFVEIDERPGEGETAVLTEPKTMADVFAEAGYDTASFGKLHLTPTRAPVTYGYPETCAAWEAGRFEGWTGPYYGFQHVELTIGHGKNAFRGGHYAEWLRREHPDALEAARESGRDHPIPALSQLYALPVPSRLHHSRWLAERMCSYLRERKGRKVPFFAFVGFPDPHHPFVPCEDVVGDFKAIEVPEPVDVDGRGVEGSPLAGLCQMTAQGLTREDLRTVIRFTYAMIFQIDRAVGHILDELEATGLAEETVVAFTSDHGDFLGDHGRLQKALGASDALVRVPLVVRAPGAGLPRRVTDATSNCDVLPTLTRLAGVKVPEGVHGTDMHAPGGDGRTAMCFAATGHARDVNYTVYDATHRMTWYPGHDFVELFDHGADPGECCNVAGRAKNRHRVREMKRAAMEVLVRMYNPINGRVSAW